MAKKGPNIKEFVKYLDQTLDIFDGYVPNSDYTKPDSDVYRLLTMLFRMYDEISKKSEGKLSMEEISEQINKKLGGGLGGKLSEKFNTIDNGNVMSIPTELDINSIIEKHIENKKKQRNLRNFKLSETSNTHARYSDSIKPLNLINSKSNSIHNNKLKWDNFRPLVESDKQALEMYNKSLNDLRTTEDEPIIFTEDKEYVFMVDKQVNGNKSRPTNVGTKKSIEKICTSIKNERIDTPIKNLVPVKHFINNKPIKKLVHSDVISDTDCVSMNRANRDVVSNVHILTDHEVQTVFQDSKKIKNSDGSDKLGSTNHTSQSEKSSVYNTPVANLPKTNSHSKTTSYPSLTLSTSGSLAEPSTEVNTNNSDENSDKNSDVNSDENSSDGESEVDSDSNSKSQIQPVSSVCEKTEEIAKKISQLKKMLRK